MVVGEPSRGKRRPTKWWYGWSYSAAPSRRRVDQGHGWSPFPKFHRQNGTDAAGQWTGDSHRLNPIESAESQQLKATRFFSFWFERQEQYWRIPSTLSLAALTARIELLETINEKSEHDGSLTTPTNELEVTSVKRNAPAAEDSPTVHKRRRIVVSDSSDDDQVADEDKQEPAASYKETNENRSSLTAAPAGRKRMTIVDSDSEWVFKSGPQLMAVTFVYLLCLRIQYTF